MGDVNPSQCMLVLAGASKWPRTNLTASTAFSNAHSVIRDYFEGAFRISSDNTLDLFDRDLSPGETVVKIGTFLRERQRAAREEHSRMTDLFFYYVGHAGFLGGENDYYLFTRSTTSQYESTTALAFRALAEIFKSGEAAFLRRYIILDCCFAAAATRLLMGEQVHTAAQKMRAALPPDRGTAVLCSSGPENPSLILDGAPLPMFTGALYDALVTGDALAPEWLSLPKLLEMTWSRLVDIPDAVRPELHSPQQAKGDVGTLDLFPNRARILLPYTLPQQLARSSTTKSRSILDIFKRSIRKAAKASVRRGVYVVGALLGGALIVSVMVSLDLEFWPSHLISGSATIMNGNLDAADSGFHFSTDPHGSRVVSWFSSSPSADILAMGSNDPASKDLAHFFLPHVGQPQPTSNAYAGIVAIDAKSLDSIGECPASDDAYDVQQGRTPTVLGAYYCVRTFDGKHYAKIHVTQLTPKEIAFDWVFQPRQTNRF